MSYSPESNIRTPHLAYGVYAASDGPRFGSLSLNAGYVTRQTGSGGVCDGIIDGESLAQGDPISLVKTGLFEVVAGAAIAAGANVMSDTSGRGVTATSGLWRMGVARTAASNAGEIIEIDLGRQGLEP